MLNDKILCLKELHRTIKLYMKYPFSTRLLVDNVIDIEMMLF